MALVSTLYGRRGAGAAASSADVWPPARPTQPSSGGLTAITPSASPSPRTTHVLALALATTASFPHPLPRRARERLPRPPPRSRLSPRAPAARPDTRPEPLARPHGRRSA